MTTTGLEASRMMSRSTSFPALIESQAARQGNRLAVADGPIRVTYAELANRVSQLATVLVTAGVEAGDRVALLLFDGLTSIEIMAACGKIGAIAVPLNWRLAASEIGYILETTKPKLVFHSLGHTSLLPPEFVGQCFSLPDFPAVDSAYELRVASASPVQSQAVAGDAPLFMLFTSGTTGRPKGCLQSHEAAVALGMSFALYLGLTAEDRLLCTSPLFHVGGLGHVFAALAAGGGIVVGRRGASHEELLQLASNEHCSFGSMNDALVMGLCDVQRRLGLPLAFRSVTRGASMTPVAQIEAIRDVLGARVVGGYGQTESLGFVLLIDGEDMLVNRGALGMPMSHVEAAVLDDSGQPLAGETTGELGIRSSAVMLGYWNDSDATCEAMGTGWLRTGDLVNRDAAGRYHFQGRSKELVKTGGENVYPREVEQVLTAHPAIADAAIVGIPDERWGEAVKACVVIREGQTLTAADVVAWCRQHIAGYKRPRYVQFVDTIPRDHLTKIQRAQLRNLPVTSDQRVE